MMRRLVRAAVQNAIVTHGGEQTLKIDPLILHAAGILPLEEVELVNHATGERVITFAEQGEAGQVSAPRMRAGDAISIVAWGTMHDGQTLNHRATIVTLSERNEVVAIGEVAAV